MAYRTRMSLTPTMAVNPRFTLQGGNAAHALTLKIHVVYETEAAGAVDFGTTISRILKIGAGNTFSLSN